MASLPEHIRVGNFVRVCEWIGKVDDIANGGKYVMVLVSSPKQMYRHSRPEWLQFIPDNPGLIKPSTKDEYEKECRAYANRALQDAEKILQMAESVGALL